MSDEKEKSHPVGRDITKMPIGELLRSLSVGSWVAILGIPTAAFWLGHETSQFFGQAISANTVSKLQSRAEALEGEKEDLTKQNAAYRTNIDSLEGDVIRLAQELDGAELSNIELAEQLVKVEPVSFPPLVCTTGEGAVGRVKITTRIFNSQNGSAHGYQQEFFVDAGRYGISINNVADIEENTSSFRNKHWGATWECVA